MFRVERQYYAKSSIFRHSESKKNRIIDYIPAKFVKLSVYEDFIGKIQ